MRILDRGRICTVATLTVLFVSLATSALSTPTFVGGGGLEYYDGPDQLTRSAMAIVGAEAGGGSASLALLRYSDSQVGDGVGYVLGIGVPLTPSAALRAWGTRFVGDETLRSWRVKAGPLVEFPGGGSGGLYFSHAEDNFGLRSNGAAAELRTPLGTRWTGLAGAAYATTLGGGPASQATVGLEFAPVRGLELSAETGVARNGSLVDSPGPSGGTLPALPGGGGGASSETSRVGPVLLLGLRVLLP